ncbi:MAG: DinB family protein [Dehalococcoidia bacterium]
MPALEVYQRSMAFLHYAFGTAAADGLTMDQLHFTPPGDSHSVAWTIWHATRGEDWAIQETLLQVPTEWEAGGWAARTKLPAEGVGLGMTAEETRQIRLDDLATFQGYAAAVAARTNAYLDRLTEGELERPITVLGRDETVGLCLALHLVNHLNAHRGEVNLIRGMLGAPPIVLPPA